MSAAVGVVALRAIERISKPLTTDIPRRIEILSKNVHQDELAQSILYYDEVLTQSARNYAFTGLKQWKTRYFESATKLDAAIKDAIENGDPQDKASFSAVDQANQALVAMESASIEHADAERHAQAIAVLESAEYQRYKAQYSKFLAEYVTRRDTASHDSVQSSLELLEVASGDAKRTLGASRQTLTVLLIAILLAVVIVWALIVSPLAPRLRNLEEAVADIAQGNFARTVESNSSDEIGKLAASINQMTTKLQTIFDESQRQRTMLEHQNWLSTAQSDLGKILRTASSLDEIGGRLAWFAAELLDAQIAATYIAEPAGTLQFRGGYALPSSDSARQSFEPGEGLVGQAALDQQPIRMSTFAEVHFTVTSSLGHTEPNHLFLYPIVWKDETLAVLELGSFQELDDSAAAFGDSISESVAFAISSLRGRAVAADSPRGDLQ